jgi:hypothetical protein
MNETLAFLHPYFVLFHYKITLVQNFSPIFTGQKVEDGQPELGLVGGGGPGRPGLAPLRFAGRHYPLRPLQASFSLEKIARFLVSAPCWPPLSSTPSAGKFQLRKGWPVAKFLDSKWGT